MRKRFVLSVVVVVALLACGTASGAQTGSDGSAQTGSANQPEKGMGPGRHEPPPRAYEDCVGRKAGDTVQHATREGNVAATCVDSPKGLVARPNRAPGAQPAGPLQRGTTP